MKKHHTDAIDLLKQLIATPSLSGKEAETAQIIEKFLHQRLIQTHTLRHNVWATHTDFDKNKPTLLLNSHHDTVKPNSGYTKDPFKPVIADGKLYGLGSNDAGGCLVSLITVFCHFYQQSITSYNLVLACTAEEEISGENGIAMLLPELGNISVAIVGEPTQMQMAVAEKGLIVLDCVAKGKSGHAAHNEGENAIYRAMQDIEWFKNYHFPKVSDYLGAIKMSTTMIEAGNQHNVVPDLCRFTVDVRTTDAYSNRETLDIINTHTLSEVKPHSLRLNPSFIDIKHPLVAAGLALGLKTYGSPTLSDQVMMPFPSVKIGPGDSARSHTADEFICLQEVVEGIDTYIGLLNNLF